MWGHCGNDIEFRLTHCCMRPLTQMLHGVLNFRGMSDEEAEGAEASPQSDVAQVGSPGDEDLATGSGAGALGGPDPVLPPGGPVAAVLPGGVGPVPRADALPEDFRRRWPFMTECADIKFSKCYCTVCNRELRRKSVVSHCLEDQHKGRARVLSGERPGLSFAVSNEGKKMILPWCRRKTHLFILVLFRR